MMETSVIETATQVQSNGPRKIDHKRGRTHGAVSSQWFSRPDDQRYTNLNDLAKAVGAVHDESSHRIINVQGLRVDVSKEDPDSLRLHYQDESLQVAPTHWSFGQICSLTNTPAAYLRRLPAVLSGVNLQYGLQNFRAESVKLYQRQGEGEDIAELRAVTGPDYGRIFDIEIVRAVQRIAGDGTGRDGFHWKIPGVMNWSDGTYNPDAPITRQSTTLFASDRDVFLFLVDDKRPIKVGTLPDGSDDLLFRGFYVWNSEVGSRSFGIAMFYLRGVCQNRMLWGVENFQEIKMIHTKYAPDRFIAEARPVLEQFSQGNSGAVIAGVNAAKAAKVAKNDDEAETWLRARKFTGKESKDILETVLAEEGRPARTVWDMVQGITAVARGIGHQDERLSMERKAGAILNKVKA